MNVQHRRTVHLRYFNFTI